MSEQTEVYSAAVESGGKHLRPNGTRLHHLVHKFCKGEHPFMAGCIVLRGFDPSAELYIRPGQAARTGRRTTNGRHCFTPTRSGCVNAENEWCKGQLEQVLRLVRKSKVWIKDVGGKFAKDRIWWCGLEHGRRQQGWHVSGHHKLSNLLKVKCMFSALRNRWLKRWRCLQGIC